MSRSASWKLTLKNKVNKFYMIITTCRVMVAVTMWKANFRSFRGFENQTICLRCNWSMQHVHEATWFRKSKVSQKASQFYFRFQNGWLRIVRLFFQPWKLFVSISSTLRLRCAQVFFVYFDSVFSCCIFSVDDDLHS